MHLKLSLNRSTMACEKNPVFDVYVVDLQIIVMKIAYMPQQYIMVPWDP